MTRVQVVGSFLSPYVRKVLACLELKGITWEIDPIVLFMGNDRFSELRTRPAEQRAALAAMGAPLTEWTLGTSTPRPGVLETS